MSDTYTYIYIFTGVVIARPD